MEALGLNIVSLALAGVCGLSCYIIRTHASHIEKFEERISENEKNIARLEDRSISLIKLTERIETKLDDLRDRLLR